MHSCFSITIYIQIRNAHVMRGDKKVEGRSPNGLKSMDDFALIPIRSRLFLVFKGPGGGL